MVVIGKNQIDKKKILSPPLDASSNIKTRNTQESLSIKKILSLLTDYRFRSGERKDQRKRQQEGWKKEKKKFCKENGRK